MTDVPKKGDREADDKDIDSAGVMIALPIEAVKVMRELNKASMALFLDQLVIQTLNDDIEPSERVRRCTKVTGTLETMAKVEALLAEVVQHIDGAVSEAKAQAVLRRMQGKPGFVEGQTIVVERGRAVLLGPRS